MSRSLVGRILWTFIAALSVPLAFFAAGYARDPWRWQLFWYRWGVMGGVPYSAWFAHLPWIGASCLALASGLLRLRAAAVLFGLGGVLALGFCATRDLVRIDTVPYATRGNLGAIRSALHIYYGDNDGVYPRSLGELTKGGKYLRSIPRAAAYLFHPPQSGFVDYPDNTPRDSGAFGYAGDPASPWFGSVWVDCTHTDTKGKVWASY